MVSINTNLQSLIVRQNLAKSTNALNLAIERMTTGVKLNHASDNAANYSIAEDMVSQLSSYDIASENITMGNDLVTTAQDTISLMQSHAERIHNLVTQAMNGTYGEESQKAIVSEINARIEEINRLYETTEYNGIQLFNNQTVEIPEDSELKPGDGGFLDESALSGPVMVEETGFIRALSSGTVDGIKDSYTDDEIAAMTKVKDLTKFTSGQTYAVTDKDDLIKLAELQNAGKSTSGVTFVLGADIDLEGIDWNPIGDYNTASTATCFRGTFNGNGHTISNLSVDNPDSDFQGLFGYVNGGKIRNLGIENADISGNYYVGALAGYTNNAQIDNCYAESTLNGYVHVGGLIGYTENCNVSECYSDVNVNGKTNVGGCIGAIRGNDIINTCFSKGTVVGSDHSIGGFAGIVGTSNGMSTSIKISNSSSFCTNIIGNSATGSFLGEFRTMTSYPDDYPSSRRGKNFISDLTLDGCNATKLENIDMIGMAIVRQYKSELGQYNDIKDESCDLTPLLEQIEGLDIASNPTTLQVGINGDESSSISFDTNFMYNLSGITAGGKVSNNAYLIINDFMDKLSAKATSLGAVSNRLDSALESTSVAMENLTSSLSTIRDADIATESSNYIKAQILQQAAATLLATANQSPSIALQLL